MKKKIENSNGVTAIYVRRFVADRGQERGIIGVGHRGI